MNGTSPSPHFEQELEDRLELLMNPYGDPMHQREHDAALRWLLEHAERAHQRILDLLGSGSAPNPPALLEALPAFGRPESVPVIQRFLDAEDPTCRVAAEALARHPGSAALDVLLAALTSPTRRTTVAAADALMTRGDATACSRLREVVGHPDEIVRYHTVQAAGTLGCLGAGELEALAREDASAEIRALAARLLRGRSDPQAGPT
jgi:HEAT repeat protein